MISHKLEIKKKRSKFLESGRSGTKRNITTLSLEKRKEEGTCKAVSSLVRGSNEKHLRRRFWDRAGTGVDEGEKKKGALPSFLHIERIHKTENNKGKSDGVECEKRGWGGYSRH